jgi:hypothetical protein
MIFIIFLGNFTLNKYVNRYFNVSCVKKDVSKYTVKSERSFFKLIRLKKSAFFGNAYFLIQKYAYKLNKKVFKKIFLINFLFKSFLFEILSAIA